MRYDIAIVTETKLTPTKMTQAELTLPGYYQPLRKDRSAQGGGVAVWVKSSLAVKQLDIDTGDNEAIWLTVQTSRHRCVAFCAAYRPGTAANTDTQLLDHINLALDSVRRDCSNIVIAGDFNVHNRDWLGSGKTTRAGEVAEELCCVHGLEQHVKQPTRGANILDLVMSDFVNL